jgi:hypothetical protein
VKRFKGFLVVGLVVGFLGLVSKAYAPPGWCWRWGGWGGGPWWSYGTYTTVQGVFKGVYPPHANLITKSGKTLYVMMGPPWAFATLGITPQLLEGKPAVVQGYLYGSAIRATAITVNGKTYTLPYGPGWWWYNQPYTQPQPSK